mgnify:CR=1 FL=1
MSLQVLPVYEGAFALTQLPVAIEYPATLALQQMAA